MSYRTMGYLVELRGSVSHADIYATTFEAACRQALNFVMRAGKRTRRAVVSQGRVLVRYTGKAGQVKFVESEE